MRAGLGGGHHSAARHTRGKFGQSGKRQSHTPNIYANVLQNSIMFFVLKIDF
jgi:hypothetical protein